MVDAVWPLTEEEMAEQMEADETWQAEPILETYSVMFNCNRLEDESIRKALSLVIDRNQLAAMAGIMAQPAEGLVPPGVPEDNAAAVCVSPKRKVSSSGPVSFLP